MLNSLVYISEIRAPYFMFGTKVTPVQEAQVLNGEHKSLVSCLSLSEFWEIELNCSDSKTPSSSQGIADNVSIIIDNIIAIILIGLGKDKKTSNALVLQKLNFSNNFYFVVLEDKQ